MCKTQIALLWCNIKIQQMNKYAYSPQKILYVFNKPSTTGLTVVIVSLPT